MKIQLQTKRDGTNRSGASVIGIASVRANDAVRAKMGGTAGELSRPKWDERVFVF